MFAVSQGNAALIAAVIAAAVALVTSWTTFKIAERRLRAELRTEFAAEEAIKSLLINPEWALRSFDEISRRLRGFDGDELRRLLVRAGAVSFDSASKRALGFT